MGRQPRHRQLTNAVRRNPRRRQNKNCWMHLYANEVTTRQHLQEKWAYHGMMATTTAHMLLNMELLRQMHHGNALFESFLSPCMSLLLIQLTVYVNLVITWFAIDAAEFDIPEGEYNQSRLYEPRQNLWLDHLSDMKAHKMMHFEANKLSRIYECFGLNDVAALSSDGVHIFISTGHEWKQGCPNRYKFHPEEIFLFMMT